MKKREKEMNKEKVVISYFEIFLLIVALFAFSYLIHDYDSKEENYENKDILSVLVFGYSEVIALMFGIIPFVYVFYKFVNNVNAETNELYCCSKTKSGNWCEMDVLENCDTSYTVYPDNCSNVDEGWCQKGCCQSNANGICNPRTSKSSCTALNGSFIANDLSCGGASCRIGCCQLGSSDARLTTQKQCDFLMNSQSISIPSTWNSEITNEIKCKYSVQGGKEGACIINSGGLRSCVYTSLEDCISRTGSESNFDVTGKYCSDKSLNTTCKAHDHKGCLDDKEDVYWFDSCGNHEEVEKDCDLFNGNYCGKEITGVYTCKDISCVIDGVTRRNGESWCEYDNVIGKGKDPAGSRHVRHVCYFGTERIQPCADFRNEICVESTSSTSSGESFSQASCRVNNWRKCMELNSKKSTSEMIEKCNKNPDCWVKHIDMAGSFKFDVCLPQYPPGFNLYDESDDLETTASGDSICSIATQRCTETWMCGIFGCWCIDNCKCSTNYFTEEMNEFCISLGDCGAWINYADIWTSGGISAKTTYGSSPGVLNGGNTGLYKARAGTKPAKPGSFEFLEGLNDENLKNLDNYDLSNNVLMQELNQNLSVLRSELDSANNNLQIAINNQNSSGIEQWSGIVNKTNSKYLEVLNQLELAKTNADKSQLQAEIERIAGAMGSPLLLYILSNDNVNSSALSSEQLNQVNANPTTSGGYFNSFSSVRSAISAQIVQKDAKAGGFEMIAALIAGVITYAITQSIMMAFMSAMMAYLFALAWIMYVYVDFSCGMWERPAGNDNCNKCNTLDVPCTKYRCQSLGELCKFVNEGTTSEMCIQMEENKTIPVIQPLYSVLTSGYKYIEVSEKGFEIRKDDGKCVDPFNMIHIGISVSPFAKCRFDSDPKKKWDEMSYEFGVLGAHILPAHQLDLMFPSPEAIRRSFAGEMICNTTQNPCKEGLDDKGRKTMVCPKCNLTDAQIEELTKTEIFVKCKTASGQQNIDAYSIKTCVNPGPDLTPPVIRQVTPGTGSYVKYGQENQKIVVYVDEPSQCRWSFKNVDYSDMDNQLECRINVGSDYLTLVSPSSEASSEAGVKIEYGLPCFGNIPLVNGTKIFIKCQDLSENGNYNTMSYEYELKKSESALKISEIRPYYGQEIISSTDPVSILFRVETKGGAQNGDAKCEFFDPNRDYVRDFFSGNYTNIHEKNWTRGKRGVYNMTFNCTDIAGNNAINNSMFRITIDDSGPRVIRVFNDGGLRITTDEYAQCRYSTKKNFVYANASEMSSGNGIEHSGYWSFNKVYYIECKDEYGNSGSRIIVSPFETIYQNNL